MQRAGRCHCAEEVRGAQGPCAAHVQGAWGHIRSSSQYRQEQDLKSHSHPKPRGQGPPGALYPAHSAAASAATPQPIPHSTPRIPIPIHSWMRPNKDRRTHTLLLYIHGKCNSTTQALTKRVNTLNVFEAKTSSVYGLQCRSKEPFDFHLLTCMRNNT